MFVRDCMKRDVVTVTPDDSLATALRLTRQHRIRHLPVVHSRGDLAGIVSDRDIRLAMPSPLTTADDERAAFLERTSIASIMSRNVITTGPGASIEDAAMLLYRHRIGALPVLDGRQRLRGVISETEILHAFIRILGVTEPSSRIEIALEDRTGELGRALMIVSEQAGLNISSVLVPPFGENGRKVAILRLETIDPREVIQALESAGYVVGWPALELRSASTEPASEIG